jgi:SAM-dependent methyltransferase
MSQTTYWNSYYGKSSHDSPPAIPSQFAVFIANEFSDSKPLIVDVGCGNGRDSLFFASAGFRTIGVDGSEAAIESCRARSSGESEFLHSTVDDPDLPQRIHAMQDIRSPVLVYARFFLHAITDEEESSFLALAKTLCDTGGRLAVEFRTNRDELQIKTTQTHFRRYVNPLEFLTKTQGYGFSLNYFVEGFGFAKFKKDDAHVARFIFSK